MCKSFLFTASFLVFTLFNSGIHAVNADTWPPQEMPITFWCGPPEPYITVQDYQKIKNAGFSIVMPPCGGKSDFAENKKILETAKLTGLTAVIMDGRMPLAITGNPKASASLKAIVDDYKKFPALLGYFITDEPSAKSFVGLKEVVAELHRLDPKHLAFINLFPSYATNDLNAANSQLGTDTYDQYMQQFLTTVKPDLLSWDYYHFLKTKDQEGFFGNLRSGQKALKLISPETPMWQIVLSVQFGNYRELNENELRFEAMQTLVFGGHGLVYFTYWLPTADKSFQWQHAIMNEDGSPGPLYEPVKHVNSEVRSLAKWLYNAQVVSTFQTGEITPDGDPQPNDVPVKVAGAGNLTVGVFRGGEGYLYVLATNRDYKKGITTKLTLSSGNHTVEILDKVTGEWKTPAFEKDADENTVVEVELGAAGAALLRWQ